MPLPDPILQPILAAPNADLLRYDAAQWCRDHGQPERAQLIEKQLQLAVLAFNPDDDAYDLALQTSQLCERHEKAWLAYDGLEQLALDFQYYRGFIERVKMPASHFLRYADTLFSRAPIRHLDLTDVAEVIDKVFQMPQLENIVTLSVSECGLRDKDMWHLANSPYLGNLRWLSLMLNDVGMMGAEILAKSQSLDSLCYVNFYGNQVDPTEELIVDQGVVLERILPKEGALIEERNGPILWLHPEAVLENDLPPNRFQMVY